MSNLENEKKFEEYKELLLENPRAFMNLELLRMYVESDTRTEKLEILRFFKDMNGLEP